MLWQRELFLVLKIDGGRLEGSREGGCVDFRGVTALMTLQFERIGKSRRRRELKEETHTQEQIEKTWEAAGGSVARVPNKTR